MSCMHFPLEPLLSWLSSKCPGLLRVREPSIIEAPNSNNSCFWTNIMIVISYAEQHRSCCRKGQTKFSFCCCFFLLGKLWSCSPTLGKSLTGNHYTSGKKADIKKVCVFAYDCVWGGAVCWGSPYNTHFIRIYTQLRCFFFFLYVFLFMSAPFFMCHDHVWKLSVSCRFKVLCYRYWAKSESVYRTADRCELLLCDEAKSLNQKSSALYTPGFYFFYFFNFF